MSEAAHAPPSRGGHAAGLLACLGLFAVVSWFAIRIAPLSTAGCHPRCGSETLSVAVNSYLILAPVTVLVAVSATIVLRRHGWWVTAPAVSGIALLGLAFWILTEIAQSAMLLN